MSATTAPGRSLAVGEQVEDAVVVCQELECCERNCIGKEVRKQIANTAAAKLQNHSTQSKIAELIPELEHVNASSKNGLSFPNFEARTGRARIQSHLRLINTSLGIHEQIYNSVVVQQKFKACVLDAVDQKIPGHAATEAAKKLEHHR